jgi:hypothetical protein
MIGITDESMTWVQIALTGLTLRFFPGYETPGLRQLDIWIVIDT